MPMNALHPNIEIDVDLSSRITYLGPEFTFSHAAAQKMKYWFHKQHQQKMETRPVGTFSDIIDCIHEGAYGVIPFYSQASGNIDEVAYLHGFDIVSEFEIPVTFCAATSGDSADCDVIASKDVALLQCTDWMACYYPHARRQPVGSTADAAKKARRNPRMIAICSLAAARYHKLTIVARGVENHTTKTIFRLIHRQENKYVCS